MRKSKTQNAFILYGILLNKNDENDSTSKRRTKKNVQKTNQFIKNVKWTHCFRLYFHTFFHSMSILWVIKKMPKEWKKKRGECVGVAKKKYENKCHILHTIIIIHIARTGKNCLNKLYTIANNANANRHSMVMLSSLPFSFSLSCLSFSLGQSSNNKSKHPLRTYTFDDFFLWKKRNDTYHISYTGVTVNCVFEQWQWTQHPVS